MTEGSAGRLPADARRVAERRPVPCQTRRVTATRPADEPLVGRFIRLTPFSEADIPALERALRHPEVFAGGFGGGPAGLPADAGAFDAFAREY